MITDILHIADTGAGTVGPEGSLLLTRFKNPFFWRGWRRTVSILMDSDYPNRIGNSLDIQIQENPADVNKLATAAVTSNPQPTTPGIITVDLTEQR